MKKRFIIATLSAIALFASPLQAANQTVKLSLPGMTCPVCPVTVKKAINNVKGVNTVDVSLENKTAVVTFDNAMTNAEALTDATADAGYPSTVTQ